jgi:homoserine kinase
MFQEVSVQIPATTANLGPGFDCLGLALTLYNRVRFVESAGGLSVTVRGEGATSLPADVPLPDAVFNAGHLGLLIRALETKNYDKLLLAMQDCLHQPYRLPLIPGMPEVFGAARDAGASGVALSGAGPAVVAFAPVRQKAIGEAMVSAFSAAGLASRMWELSVDTDGVIVTSK